MKIRIFKKDDKYEGLTLVEMLITLVIVAIILIVVSETLVALIKASAISSARSLSRGESEFILELLEKEISNSESDDIRLYEFAPGDRSVDASGNVTYHIADPGSKALDIFDVLDAGKVATEIHMQPIGSDEWICVGLIQGVDDQGKPTGYIMKNSSPTQRHDCFNPGPNNPIFLSSEEVNVQKFDIKFLESGENNFTFLIDLTLLPVHWIPGNSSSYRPEYIRQLIVSTEKLTF